MVLQHRRFPALRLLAHALVADGWHVPGVGALKATSRAFAEVWSAVTGQTHRAGMNERVYELRRVIPPEPPIPGALRVATSHRAKELGRYGIRVNSVVPGYIWGASLQGYFAMQAKQRGIDAQAVYDEVAAQTALRHLPTSEEIADAVVFFASDLSRVVTGQSLDVNGGHLFH